MLPLVSMCTLGIGCYYHLDVLLQLVMLNRPVFQSTWDIEEICVRGAEKNDKWKEATISCGVGTIEQRELLMALEQANSRLYPRSAADNHAREMPEDDATGFNAFFRNCLLVPLEHAPKISDT
eukprot:Gb_01182 [translate_table: standard]